MIRINLLPVRVAKKKEAMRFQLTVAVLVTFMIIVISSGVYLMVRSEASALSRQVKANVSELDDLAKKLGKLSKIEEEKAVVQEKLDTITKLEEGKSGPIKLFKIIANALPEKSWLESIRETTLDIAVKGYGADEKVVADIQRRLQEHTKDFGVPELIVAQRVTEKETGLEVVSFEIRIVKPVAPVVKDKDKKAKKKEAGKKDSEKKEGEK